MRAASRRATAAPLFEMASHGRLLRCRRRYMTYYQHSIDVDETLRHERYAGDWFIAATGYRLKPRWSVGGGHVCHTTLIHYG